MKSDPELKTKVNLFIDSHSWLSFAFPTGTRMCATTKCTSEVIDYPTDLIDDRQYRGTSVFLTSWGGRQSSIVIPKSMRNQDGQVLKAAVFMENDLRFFDSQASFDVELLGTIYPSFDLVFGFSNESILSREAIKNYGYKLPEWRQLAYVDDPIESFTTEPALPFHQMIPKIAFFSSQCSPVFAQTRIQIMQDLSELLGDRLSSFGSCFHNAKLSDAVPQCVGIPVHNVDHGTASCLLFANV